MTYRSGGSKHDCRRVLLSASHNVGLRTTICREVLPLLSPNRCARSNEHGHAAGPVVRHKPAVGLQGRL